MANFAAILSLVGVLLFLAGFIGLLLPKLVKMESRKASLLKLMLPAFIMLVIAGILIPAPSEKNTSVDTTEINTTTSQEKEKVIKSSKEEAETVNNEEDITKPKSEQKQDADKKEVEEKKVELDPITYKEISKKAKKLTDLQFEEYAKTLTGKKVQWKGRVLEVEKKMFGGYEILVDMDKRGAFSVQDVYIPVTKEVAIGINKGDTIKFQGEIKSVLEILESVNIHIENAKVL